MRLPGTGATKAVASGSGGGRSEIAKAEYRTLGH